MKKLFFGLLIIAAGAGAFFYFKNKKQIIAASPDQKELILGKWKMNSIQTPMDSSSSFMVGIMGMVDTNLMKYDYEFTKDGNIRRSLGDSLTKDSSRYEWNATDQLVWKDYPSDTTGELLKITRLTTDSLQLQSPDSAIIIFTKLK
jgi:hypothetical protein